MPIPSAISDLSKVASENSPAGTESVKGTIDDYLRAGFAFTRQLSDLAGGPSVILPSAATVNIGFAASANITITGTTTITGFDTVNEGALRHVVFAGSLTLIHDGTKLQLPGAANIVTASGDSALFKSMGAGNWKCMAFQRVSGAALIPALPLAGGTMTGNQIFNNNLGVFMKDSGGTVRQVITLAADNNMNMAVAGGQNFNVYNQAGTTLLWSMTNTGSVNQKATLVLDNGVSISGKDTGGTSRFLMNLATDNNVYHTVAGGLFTRWFNQAFTTELMQLSNTGALNAISMTQTSDERYKWKWQRPPKDLVDKLARLKKYGSFMWKGKHKDLGQGIGAGAQSLEAIWPPLVNTDDDGFKRVQYSTGGVVIGIALCERVVELEARIARLEAALEAA